MGHGTWDKFTAGEMKAEVQIKPQGMGDPSKKEKEDIQGWKAEGLTLKDTQLCTRKKKMTISVMEGTHNSHQEFALGKGKINGIIIVANIY